MTVIMIIVAGGEYATMIDCTFTHRVAERQLKVRGDSATALTLELS